MHVILTITGWWHIIFSAHLPLLDIGEFRSSEEVFFDVVFLHLTDRGPFWDRKRGVVGHDQEASLGTHIIDNVLVSTVFPQQMTG